MAIKSPTTHEVRGMVALLKSAVKAADMNGDGRIDRTELGEAIRQAGGNRAHASRIMALDQAHKGSSFDIAPTVKTMQARLDRLGAAVIGADVNQNNRVSYGEMVKLRADHPDNLGYAASIMWGAALGN